jgi:hypothetical protein
MIFVDCCGLVSVTIFEGATVFWKDSGKQVTGDKVKEWHLLLVQKMLLVSVSS